MVKRRTFLKSAGSIGTVGILAGCISGTGGGGSGNNSSDGGDGSGGGGGGGGGKAYIDGKLKFLMSPTEPQDQMRAQYKPIKERFQSYLKNANKVEMQYARNYAATLTALGSGTADVAETGPFAAALGVKSGNADVILQRFGYGSWTYSSVIVTREGSGINSLKDLKGKKIAFADALSASGSLYPLWMLKQAGLSIPEEPGSPAGADFEPSWSSHSTAFNALKQEKADAAGVGRFIVVARDNENREYKKPVKELKRKKGIPRAPIVVSPKLSKDEKKKITKAFTEAPKDMYFGENGKDEGGDGDDLWFDKVRKADASTYDPVVKVANDLGYGQDIFK